MSYYSPVGSMEVNNTRKFGQWEMLRQIFGLVIPVKPRPVT